eukprot:Opistho-2@28827
MSNVSLKANMPRLPQSLAWRGPLPCAAVMIVVLIATATVALASPAGPSGSVYTSSLGLVIGRGGEAVACNGEDYGCIKGHLMDDLPLWETLGVGVLGKTQPGELTVVPAGESLYIGITAMGAYVGTAKNGTFDLLGIWDCDGCPASE